MRALTIRESTWLNASPGAVWRLVLSLEEWPRWNSRVSRVRWCGARGWKEGHRFALRYPEAGRILGPWLPRSVRVSRVEPHQELRGMGRFLGFRVEFSVEVVGEGAGSRAHFASHFRGLSARIVAGERVARRFSAFQREFLAALRRAGERVGGRRG